MFIRNAWYAAALSSEIKTELFARTILNEQVLMYRTSNGKIAALEDRCPHRQVPLSKGCLQGDQVQCWYHGIRFDAAGNCVHIPSQKIIPQRANVKSFPVAEKHGFVWIWMGDPKQCEASSIPNHSICASPNWAGEMSYFPSKADYRFGIDNLLDLSHIAFVHPHTVMSQGIAEATPEIEAKENQVLVRRVSYNEKSSPLLSQMMKLERIDHIQDVIFWPVGNIRIDTAVSPPGQTSPCMRLVTAVIFTPETQGTTHIWAGFYRDFALDNEQLSKITAEGLRATVLEDTDVTDHLHANWKQERPIMHLAADQASIAARQMLDKLLRQETREQGYSIA